PAQPPPTPPPPPPHGEHPHPPSPPPSPPPPHREHPAPAASSDNALDLGATVLPVLIKSYGKQAAAGLGVLVLLLWLLRRRKCD
ncbi:MAG: carbon monoxide dehydrogenase, partial [Nocardioides sp.]|nr:carbon monoxide dehydrogenase [Nocardioides sp.]